MKRKDIIDKLAERGYTKTAADIILSDVITVFVESLIAGEELRLHGFGTFSVRETKERMVKDMTTGEWITVPPMKVPKFTAGKLLKRAVKEGLMRD